MRVLKQLSDYRAVTLGGHVMFQHKDGSSESEWWTILTVPLETLREAAEEWQGFAEENGIDWAEVDREASR